MSNREFYVGYLNEAPPRIARFVRLAVLSLLVVAAFLAGMLVSAQGRFAASVFEFGNTRAFSGFISEYPYPTLLVERPGVTDGKFPYSRYLLSIPGKSGAQQAVAGLDGQFVTLSGTLVYRDDITMIEVDPDTPAGNSSNTMPAQPEQALGQFTLRGEIVDSKCYLGVMKPGNLKPHRACAVRCISGGIPPVLLVRNGEGNAIYFMLTGSDGRQLNKDVASFVAEPIEIRGNVIRQGGMLILQAEPSSYLRLGAS